jgi:3-oxoacyl-[acyl-carrier-protein] synthase III
VTPVVNPIGIGRIHCLLPDDRVRVADLPEVESLGRDERDFVDACGIDTVSVFEDEEGGALAARACRTLLEDCLADPDLLLLVGARSPDVLLGSDASRVQLDAGLRSSFAFTVDGLGCAGSSAAWAIGRDLLLADPERESVIIAHASRPTGMDRVRFPVTVIGDGAYAMTLVRGGRPALRAHRMETDGTFHDLFRVDYRQTPWYEWREECTSPDRYRFELAMQSKVRVSHLVDKVREDAGVRRDQVRTMVMQNITASAYEFYEFLTGIPVDPLCRSQLAEFGHLGAMDVVLNFDRLLSSGRLDRGDLVLILNNSPVAAWAVSLWEV